MENMISDEGLILSDMSLSEMDVFWDKAKEKYIFTNKMS
jgi:uncharacterized protein YabN with tetrapyrrole methylase and pyrophosphatase domain